MFKLLLLVLVKLLLTSSLVIDPRFSVIPRQFFKDKGRWFDGKGEYPTFHYQLATNFSEYLAYVPF